jgi:hypothetical protein
MSDDNSEKHDPIEAVRNGLGLLFRVARTTLDRIPKRQFEEAVVAGARQVGRTIDSVTEAIDKRVFKPGLPPPKGGADGAAEPKPEPGPPPAADEPRGPTAAG